MKRAYEEGWQFWDDDNPKAWKSSKWTRDSCLQVFKKPNSKQVGLCLYSYWIDFDCFLLRTGKRRALGLQAGPIGRQVGLQKRRFSQMMKDGA